MQRDDDWGKLPYLLMVLLAVLFILALAMLQGVIRWPYTGEYRAPGRLCSEMAPTEFATIANPCYTDVTFFPTPTPVPACDRYVVRLPDGSIRGYQRGDGCHQ